MNETDAERATEVYRALTSTGQLASRTNRLLTYRCKERQCALLHVFDMPGLGVVVAKPRHKTSAAETARTSNAAGRAKHTEDADRRWKAQAAPIAQWGNPTLTCDHVRYVVLQDEELHKDWEAHESVMLVNRDGTRRAAR